MGDSVQIVRGDSYVSVLIFEHTSDVSGLVEELGQKMGKKWRRFEPADHGESMLAGRKASTVWYAGVNAQSVKAVLKLAGVVSDHTAYVVVTGTPEVELPKLKEILAQIEQSFTLLAGSAQTPHAEATLGLEATDLNAEDAAAYGLKEASGALVITLVQGGPAQQAGIQLHDVVITAGGQSIDGVAAIQQIVKSHKVGDELAVELLRIATDGKTVERKTLRVTLRAVIRPN
jgi:C-terminal processing protease CtpA/Prc